MLTSKNICPLSLHGKRLVRHQVGNGQGWRHFSACLRVKATGGQSSSVNHKVCSHHLRDLECSGGLPPNRSVMPYRIENRGGERPFKIINKETGKVVGSSKTMKAAQGSIAHRLEGERKKK